MTNIFKAYSFMDLLKEYNHVPKTDLLETTYSQDINGLINKVSTFIKERTEDTDFMDLLAERGYQSAYEILAQYSNDNEETVEEAS